MVILFLGLYIKDSYDCLFDSRLVLWRGVMGVLRSIEALALIFSSRMVD